MCQNPVRIPNPYFSNKPFKYENGSVSSLDTRFVSKKPLIDVPCGKCPDCRASYNGALLQRVQMESLTSYVYMVTLTYDDAHIPKLSFTTDDGLVDLYYADVSHIQALYKRLRDRRLFKDRGLRYLSVTEYGSRRFRPHHHMMMFVAKKSDDTDVTPFVIERWLYMNIKILYAANYGTRKKPIYEPYFTYREAMFEGKLTHNYDVRLIRDLSSDLKDAASINSIESIGKTASYVLSYITKPSAYEDELLPFLENYSHSLGPDMARSLKRILKCRCNYSKHLGFGFYEDGSRVNPSICCRSLTYDTFCLDTFFRSLPPTRREFEDLCPDFACKLWRYTLDGCRNSDTFEDFLLNEDEISFSCPMSEYLSRKSSDFFYNMLIIAKYDYNLIDVFMRRVNMATRSFHPAYLPKTWNTQYQSSVAFKELRSMLSESLASRVPFLGFRFVSNGSVRFVPMCKYFRRYVTTYDDVAAMYDSIGVRDFDDYIALIEKDEALTLQRALTEQNCRDRAENVHSRPDYEQIFNKKLLKTKLNSIFAPTYSSICRLLP